MPEEQGPWNDYKPIGVATKEEGPWNDFPSVIDKNTYKKATGGAPSPVEVSNFTGIKPDLSRPENVLPTVFGAVGGAAGSALGETYLGGTAGKLAGGFLGNTLSNLASNAVENPEYVKEYPVRALGGAGVNAAGQELVGAGINKLGGSIRDRLIRQHFPFYRSADEMSTLKTIPPEVPYTVSQATGDRNLGVKENTFAPQRKFDVTNEQDEIGKNYGAGILSPDSESLIQQAVREAKGSTSYAANTVRGAYEDFNSSRAALPGQPILKVGPGGTYTIANMKNPVTLQNTSPVAEKAYNEILTKIPNAKRVEDQLNPIFQDLNYLRSVAPIGPHSAVEFDRMKALHDNINDFLEKSGDASWQHLYGTQYKGMNGILANLNRSIQSDIDTSVKSWGGDLYDKYTKAKDLYIQKMNMINPEMSQKLLKYGVDPEIGYRQIGRDALSSVEKTRQWLNITGDKQTLGEMAMQKAVVSGIDPVSGRVNAKKVLSDILDPEKADIYREAIPSSQRGNFTEFWKRLSAIEDTSGGAKQQRTFLAYHGARISMGIGLGTLAAMGGHSLPLGMLTTGMGTASLYGFENYIGKLMTNPQVARALVEGTKIPAASPATERISKILVRGLAGIPGLYLQDSTDPESPKIPVKVTNGSLSPEGR